MVGKYDSMGNVVELGYVPMSDKRGLAGRATTTKARTFDSIEEAVAAGYAPEPSYSKTLMLRSRSAAREAVNIRVGGWIAEHLKKASRGEVEGLTVQPGHLAGQSSYGQTSIEVLTNRGRRGVGVTEYKLEGPQAQKLRQFAEEIAHEGELRQANKLVAAAGKVSAQIRFAILTADLSVLTIQGLLAWSGHPLKATLPGLKAAAGGMRTLGDPKGAVKSLMSGEGLGDALKVLTDYKAVGQTRASIIDDFAQGGGFTRHPKLIVDYGGLSEFTEGAAGLSAIAKAAEAGVRKIPKVGGQVGAVVGTGLRGADNALDRFSLMFDYVRDVAAVRLAEITDDASKNMTGPAKQAFIDAQDNMHNKMLGRLRTQSLGVGADQRALESGLLFLAPQYYRATFGMLTQALEGGIRGREARKLLLKSIGTLGFLVAGANVASSQMRGDNEKQTIGQTLRSLNPTSKEFMSVRLDLPGEADIRVGLGGMQKALMSLLMELTVGEEFFTGNEPYNKGLGGRVNTAIRFGEARPAPILGLLTDLMAREDFVGQSTDIGTVEGAKRLLTSNTLPIFLQNAVQDWDNKHMIRTAVLTGAGVLGLNARDLGTQDIRDWGARELYPSAVYGDLDSWEKKYVSAKAQPQLQRLFEQRIETQSDDMSSANVGMQRIEYTTEREQKLLDVALNPAADAYGQYFSWIRADEFERGQQSVIGDLYSLMFDERPDNVPEGALEEGYDLWVKILEEDDQARKDYYLAAFDAEYPPSSEVGQYIRRQTNQRRVPMSLLQQLPNYARTKSVLYSAYARYQHIYRKVEAEEGPEAATQKAADYWAWFFMTGEAEAGESQLQAVTSSRQPVTP